MQINPYCLLCCQLFIPVFGCFTDFVLINDALIAWIADERPANGDRISGEKKLAFTR
jgi:hypothetical protein